MLSAGKLAALSNTDNTFQQWLYNTAGITHLKLQGHQADVPFTITGVTGDTLGDGISLLFNATALKIAYTDVFLQLVPDATPFIQYPDGEAAAVHRILPSGARIFCLGFTANVSQSSEADFATLTQRILQWLLPTYFPVKEEETAIDNRIYSSLNDRQLRITLPKNDQFYRLSLFDLRGRSVQHTAGIASGETLWWDLRNLPSGIYCLKYATYGNVVSQLFNLLR